MKFILMVEEDGYQVRYWDEITEEIGDSIAESWDSRTLYEGMKQVGMNISHEDFKKAYDIIESGEQPFVVLKSTKKKDMSLEIFLNSQFTLDND